MTSNHTGVVDRIVDNEYVVVLFESTDDSHIDSEYTFPQSSFDLDFTEGMVIEATFDTNGIEAIDIDVEQTRSREENLRERYDNVSSKLNENG